MKIQAGRYYTILDRSEMFGKANLSRVRWTRVGSVLKVTKVTGIHTLSPTVTTEEGFSLTERSIQHLKPATRKQIAKYERGKVNVS